MTVWTCSLSRGPPPRVWGELPILSPPGSLYGPPPRVWGELAPLASGTRGPPGPPPRVWGERPRTSHHAERTPVHPHACGENPLSPCAWGDGRRSTPTRVGRTFPTLFCQPLDLGPPPRVWGEHNFERHGRNVFRSTPTRVGRTTRPSPPPSLSTVHPHACGENTASDTLPGLAYGPPPRVWGERVHATARWGRQPVHPHACGENSGFQVHNLPMRRSTPTRVGRTSYYHDPQCIRSVHPHACGENKEIH